MDDRRRVHFPFASQPLLLYLDHHATTPLDPDVLASMLPCFTAAYGNPSSVGHRWGRAAREAIEAARVQVAELLGFSSAALESGEAAQSIVFTSGATEANNLAIKGAMAAAAPGSHFIVTAAEHRSVLDPARTAARAGHKLTILPVDGDGRVSPAQVAAAIGERTALVSAIFANNEIGSINDVAAIGAECRRRNVIFHTDAVQAAGLLPIDWSALPIDLLSLSAHKLYGPQGIGALVIRRDRASPDSPNSSALRLAPLLEGGGQEQRLRSGTVPTALAVGFGRACQLCRASMGEEAARLAVLRDRFWGLLREQVGGIECNGSTRARLPNNLSVRIAGIQSEALLARLADELAASSGAACSTSDPRPSHVLAAIGLSESEIASTIRFGLGRSTQEDDIVRATAAIARVVAELRGTPACGGIRRPRGES